jgi:hypothetical protein
MSKRLPKQHEIDELACRQFAQTLPGSWRVREQGKDYGVDAEVEIFDQGASTGALFKVQIKGTQRPRLLADGHTISLSVSADDVIYWCAELAVPLVVVLADVYQKRTWWHAIQLDRDLRERLSRHKQASGAKVTIHLNSARKLPDTISTLHKAILDSEILLASRSVSAASADTFLGAMASVPNLDDIESGLQQKISFLRIEKLDRLQKRLAFGESEAVARGILEDKTSSVEATFAAILHLQLLAMQEARLSDRLDECPRLELEFALRLKSTSRGGPLHLRAFAALAVRAAKLHQYVQHDFSLFINARVCQDSRNRESTEPLWALMQPAVRSRAAVLVTQKFEQCSRLLRFMVRNGLFHIIPRSTALVTMSAQSFVLRLWEDDMTEGARAYEQSLGDMARAGVDIAVQLGAWDDASLNITHAAWLCNWHDEASVNARQALGEQMAMAIRDSGVRDETLAQVRSIANEIRRSLTNEPPEAIDLADEKRIYKRMAASLGIDLGNPNDEIANVVRIGILDLDPTRVLIKCRHLFLRLSGGGMPARMLQLPSAGFKTLYCTLHGYGISALSLDAAYGSFREDHCTKCCDAEPHPSDWTWSHCWQEEQLEQYGDRFRTL